MALTAIIMLVALAQGAVRIGDVRGVSVASNDNGAVTFRVTGNNPCGALHFEYGDGNAITHPIEALPSAINYRYATSGEYTVVIRGMGNCEGQTSVRLRANVPPAPAPPPAVQPPAASPQGRARGRGQGEGLGRGRQQTAADRRFGGMDRDNDDVVTRAEWQGSDESFRVHDWNRDGVLSGAEIRTGEIRPEDAAAARASGGQVPAWTRATFRTLDANGDSRVTAAEWRYGAETFRRVDRNGDRAVTVDEFLATDIDDDRDDRFEYLDLNDDGFLSGTEWHGSSTTFEWLDQNRDRRLSRTEVVGEAGVSAAAPRTPAAGAVTRLRLPANTAWVDTGLAVRAGDEIVVRATGEIQASSRADDRADAEGSIDGRLNWRAPLPRVPVGAVIGRVGQSAPFELNAGAPVRMPQNGRLFLGINDDTLTDNRGQFDISVTRH